MLPGFSAPRLISSEAADGTENQTVILFCSRNLNGASISIGCIAQTAAPLSQAMNRSKTERSNVWSKVCVTRSARVRP